MKHQYMKRAPETHDALHDHPLHTRLRILSPWAHAVSPYHITPRKSLYTVYGVRTLHAFVLYNIMLSHPCASLPHRSSHAQLVVHKRWWWSYTIFIVLMHNSKTNLRPTQLGVGTAAISACSSSVCIGSARVVSLFKRLIRELMCKWFGRVLFVLPLSASNPRPRFKHF
jgi:hypothetical protein